METLPADPAHLVGSHSGIEPDVIFDVGESDVVPVDQLPADRPLRFRIFILFAFVIFTGEIVSGFVGEVVRRLAEQRAVAVENGYLAFFHRAGGVQKRFQFPVRFGGEAGDRAVSLGVDAPCQHRENERCDRPEGFFDHVGSGLKQYTDYRYGISRF